MFDKDNIEIWVSAVAVIVLGLYKSYKFVKEFFIKTIYKRENKKYFVNSIKVNDLCTDATNLNNGFVDRIYRFYGHDSGSKPRVGKPYYATALKGYYKDTEKHGEIEDYRKLLLDDQYKRYLLHVIENGYIDIIVDEMPDCLLKRIYIQEKIVYSRIYFLDISLIDMFYISLSWYTIPTEEELYKSDMLISKIRPLHHD